MIDGEYPFAEAKQLILSRVWKDESEISTDSEGNDIYPGQIQTPEWITYYLRDSHGYYAEPFLFALTEGEHVFRFSSVEESVVIRSVLFTAEQEILSYKEALAEYYAAGYSEVKDYFSAADLAVLPYRSATQSGISSVSYHFEVPMIVTDTGGLKETIGDRGTGIVADECTPECILKEINRFFSEPGLQEECIRNIRLEKERLSWNTFVLKLEDFIRTLK